MDAAAPLLTLLELAPGAIVALVGAGGKTTLLYSLAAQARARGQRVIVTTTTHMGTLGADVTGPVLVEQDGDCDAALDAALERGGLVTLLGRRVRPDKLAGVAPERVEALARRADLVLVEADGARQRSLKLPAAHEPVVPATTALMLVVAAVDVLGEPLDERRVHRLELVCQATGCAVGETVGEATLVTTLCHPSGYPSRRPAGARAGVFLNKVDDWALAARLAAALAGSYDLVAAGHARAAEVRRLA